MFTYLRKNLGINRLATKQSIEISLSKFATEEQLDASLAELTKQMKRRLAAIEKRLPPPKEPPYPTAPLLFSRLPQSTLSCPVCEANAIRHSAAYPSNVTKFRTAIIMYCSECGSGFTPDAGRILESYYEREYATANRKDRDMPAEEYFNQTSPETRYRHYFERAEAQVAALSKHGANFDRVLDYGSGPGYFLHVSKAAKKYAVELDEHSDKYLDFLGAERISSEMLHGREFDVIVASHVIEHFTAETLKPNVRAMADALTAGGLLLVEVPHGGHTFAALDSRQDPHTLFFSPEGIWRTVEAAGLSIVSAYPREKREVAPHPSPIYAPSPDNDFFQTRCVGLTVIAKKRQS
jgi:2-polyprenyl-3-methyl-5-hydroxy-6-metoxy-1,4-benzoquinol methylase